MTLEPTPANRTLLAAIQPARVRRIVRARPLEPGAMHMLARVPVSAPFEAAGRPPSPVAIVLLAVIRVYRRFLSPLKARPTCRFHPTCSAYALQAIETHGAIRGSWLAAGRVLKCHPLHPGGFDPVPPRTVQPASPRAHDQAAPRPALEEE